MDTKKQKLRPSLELIKITPNPERVKSILHMANLLEERITLQDKEKMAALVTVDYYEIIKELLTAILLLEGYKTLSHKDLFEYMHEKSAEMFDQQEKFLLNELRILRNRVSYEGFKIQPSYLERNQSKLKEIIQRIKQEIIKKLEKK